MSITILPDDILLIIFNKVRDDLLEPILLSNKYFYNNFFKQYKKSIKSFKLNINYYCIVCYSKALNNSAIILCNCIKNYSVIHLNCCQCEIKYNCETRKCPICNNNVSWLRTNIQSNMLTYI